MHNMSNIMWIFLLSFLCLLTAPLTAQTTGLCGDGVRACMNHYVTYTLKHANEQRLDLMCQDVNELMVCVFALDCLEEDKKEQIVREVRREIAAQGFVCEVDLDSVTTRAPGQERSTLSADTSTCLGATEACTKSYVEASLKLGGQTKEEVVEKFCPKISEYLDCLIYSPCNLEQVKEVFREKVEKKLEEQGIECDLNYYEKEGLRDNNENGLRDNNENGLRDNNENGANRYLMSGGAVILVVLSTWCLWFKSDF